MYFYPLTFSIESKKKFPLLLLSHNCIIIHNVQFSRYMFELSCFHKRLNEISQSFHFQKFQSISYLFTIHSYFKKWWAKMDSLCCGKATAVATVHRTVAKSRLSSPFWLSRLYALQSFGFALVFQFLKNGGPKWTRTIDLTIISRVL